MPQTIAIVSDAVMPFHKGGKEARIYNVSKELVARGHDVHIYTMQWWDGGKTTKHEGITYHAISKLYPLYVGNGTNTRSIKSSILFSLACLRLLRARFDVVDVDQIPYFPIFTMWIVCLLKRKPLNVTWHEVWGKAYWQQYLGGLSGFIAHCIEYTSVRFPDTIVAVSPQTAESLTPKLGRTHAIQTVPNGVNTDELIQVKPSEKTSDIIFTGRLLPHKNVTLLIHAMAVIAKRNPTITCTIIGDGPERPVLEALVTKLGLQKHITFAGRLEHNTDVFARMKAAKVFAFPSTREGFGIVALEAICLGLKVVTVDVPDNAARHLVTTATGSVTKPTPAAFAKALMLQLENTASSRSTAAELRRQYGWEAAVDELDKVYGTTGSEAVYA